MSIQTPIIVLKKALEVLIMDYKSSIATNYFDEPKITKTSSSTDVSPIDLIFLKIWNDIEIVNQSNLNKVDNIAHSFIKRFASAGLCIFEYYDYRVYRQIYWAYVHSELDGGYDYPSNCDAIAKAFEFLKDYDFRFNSEVVFEIIATAHLEKVTNKTYDEFIEDIYAKKVDL